MAIGIIIIIVLYLVQPNIAQGENDPCNTVKTIDDWHRSVDYTSTNGIKICDSTIQEGWYRVTSGAGERMPTQCVDPNHCGTTFPIYLSNDGVPQGEDIFPTEGSVVNRVAYANIVWDCTAKSYSISIKNCTLYYVYYLIKTGGCDVAYCFGSGLPCPPGQSSPTGFSPGCEIRKPNLSMTPVISVQEHEEHIKNVTVNGTVRRKIRITPEFSCNAIEATDDFNYDIKYYINDHLIPDASYINISYYHINTSTMLQEHWDHTFKPNMLVTCTMQARYKDGGGPSEINVSDIFFAGIKTIDTENGVWVKEAGEIQIGIQVTMPIGCEYVEGISDPDCDIFLHNGVPKYMSKECDNYTDNDLEFGEQNCRLSIPHHEWNETHFVTVKGKSDGIANRADRIVFLRLYTPTASANVLSTLHIWNKIILPDVKIYIIDTDIIRLGQSCYSHNDPHMRIFDRQLWELQRRVNEGEYIMYKHDRLPQQVNAYFRPCYYWDALCNCGVAVRSADSIFIANFCPGGQSNDIHVQTNRYIISRMCDDQNLVVEDIGVNTQLITMPSGTTVKIRHGPMWWFPWDYVIHSIDITPSILDYKLTSGLCGNYSDDDGDDFVSPNGTFIGLDLPRDGVEFGKEWKVTTEADSFFNSDGSLPQLTYKLQEYCTCVGQDLNSTGNTNLPPDYMCALSTEARTCRSKEIPRSVIHAQCITTSFGRKRRSIEEFSDVPDVFPMIVDDTDTTSEPVAWRNNLTEEKARQKCEESFKERPAFTLCRDNVPSVEADEYIEECVTDMKITGSDVFLTTTIETFESNCVTGAEKMEALKYIMQTDEFGNTKSIFDLIAESACPNNCSAQGVCNTGVCQCYKGYYGSDCSLDETTPPTILKSSLSGKCDSSTKPCLVVYVPGIDFIPAKSTCRYRGIKLFKSGTVTIDQVSTSETGEYLSSFQIKCVLPRERKKRSVQSDEIATGFHISVSNDGTTFSEEVTILIYDATCFECNTSTLTCHELDTCLTKGEGNDTGNDEGNDKGEDISKDEVHYKTSNYMIIGLAVGVTVVVVVGILSIMTIKKRCRNRRPYVTGSTVSLPDTDRPMTGKSVLKESDIFMRMKTSESFNTNS